MMFKYGQVVYVEIDKGKYQPYLFMCYDPVKERCVPSCTLLFTQSVDPVQVIAITTPKVFIKAEVPEGGIVINDCITKI